MTTTNQECDQMWGNLTGFQKKQLLTLWEDEQKTKPKLDFCDDVWGLIKEFAGIYHITTEWDKVYNVSATKLYNWYKVNMKYSISGLGHHNSQRKKAIILKFFYKKQRNKKTMENLYYLIIPHTKTDETVKPQKVVRDFTKYRVGQEVFYRVPLCDGKCGVIKKINKASINVDFYGEIEIGLTDPNAVVEQYMTTMKYQYNKDIFVSNRTIRANFKTSDEMEEWMRFRLITRHQVMDYGL